VALPPSRAVKRSSAISEPRCARCSTGRYLLAPTPAAPGTRQRNRYQNGLSEHTVL